MNTSIHKEQPVYASLAEKVRDMVRIKHCQPGDFVGSEYALARQYDVSRVTIRRATELLVNERLLERRPGKGLFIRSPQIRTRTIQVIVGNLEWDRCVKIVRGVQLAAPGFDAEVQLYDAHGDAELDLQAVRDLPSGRANGAIIISLHGQAFTEGLFQLKLKEFPCVLVDQSLHDIIIPSVTADNYTGGRLVAQSLLGCGHLHIGFIGDLEAHTVRERLAGLRDAINDAGYVFDRSAVTNLEESGNRLGDWHDDIRSSLLRLMERPIPPTAIACSCDAVARSVYRVLEDLNLTVPKDVSVVGFDDDPLAQWLTPPLSTVRQPLIAMGRRAVELLDAQMTASVLPSERVVMPVEFIDRDSIASPGGANTGGRVGSKYKNLVGVDGHS